MRYLSFVRPAVKKSNLRNCYIRWSVILTLLHYDTRKCEFDIRKITIMNWTDFVKKLESLFFFFLFIPSHSYFRGFNHYANKVTQRNRTKKHRDDFIRDYIRKFQDGSRIHLVFSTARTNSSFHSFFFQLVNFYDIFFNWRESKKKNHLVKKICINFIARDRSKKERTHVSERLQTNIWNNYGVK